MTAAGNAEYTIDVRGLNKHFGTKHVVKDVSLRVRRGEIFGFLGPNGSGKTTTIRMMCGLLKPDSGTGTCLGYDIVRERTEIKRRAMYQIPQRRQVVHDTLEQLGLAKRARQLAGELSGGWKQRLALAACMLHNPALLLLDEPTAGVDPRARRDFWDEIQMLDTKGISVLVSTHYMDEAVRCHKLAYIAFGTLLTQGTAQEVIAGRHLTTWAIHGERLTELQQELRRQPGVEQTVTFGDVLHVSGTDADRLQQAVLTAASTVGRRAEKVETGLEDVFIELMGSSNPDAGGKR
jgi:ABC-2 type transport system ATP-binding protein